jgi:hypothetical protein
VIAADAHSKVQVRLRVAVGGHPEPGLLRAAITARLSGRTWPTGPEGAIAEAVVKAVAEAAGHSSGGPR